MSRIMQEPKQHIHDKLVSELNEMSIRIKLHHLTFSRSVQQSEKIKEAREQRPSPTWEEINDLLEHCRDEMNQCTQPYKIHR